MRWVRIQEQCHRLTLRVILFDSPAELSACECLVACTGPIPDSVGGKSPFGLGHKNTLKFYLPGGLK